MKGQFFVISAVVIISSLVLLSSYLSDFGRPDMSVVQQMQEIKYVSMVKNTLADTAMISYESGGCGKIGSDIAISEKFLKETLLFKGVVLDITHDTTACLEDETIDFWFRMKSARMEATGNFTAELG